MVIECSPELRYPPPHDVQYDGNRFRCHDPEPAAIAAHQRDSASDKFTRNENRFIRRVVDDMERLGIVTLLPDWVEPQSQPVIMQGDDGALDLYFPYEHTETRADGQKSPSLPFPPTNSLVDFANAWKQQYPDGIIAKGSIQTHYCAWPMPTMRSLGNIGSNFATPEGHVYHWNAMRKSTPHSTQENKTDCKSQLSIGPGPPTRGSTTSNTTSTTSTRSSTSTSPHSSSAPWTRKTRSSSRKSCWRLPRIAAGGSIYQGLGAGSRRSRI